MNLRGRIDIMYKEECYVVLHTKYKRSRSHGVVEKYTFMCVCVFFFFFFFFHFHCKNMEAHDDPGLEPLLSLGI